MILCSVACAVWIQLGSESCDFGGLGIFFAKSVQGCVDWLQEDAQALSAHLLDAATMATGEMGVVRRSRAHPAHRPQPGLPSVQDSFDLAAYVPTAGVSRARRTPLRSGLAMQVGFLVERVVRPALRLLQP